MNTKFHFCGLASIVIALAIGSRLGVAQQSVNSPKFALLIGCSDYQHLPGKNLRGPKNDVRELAQVLVTRFAFAPADVRQLLAWPDDVALRPTRENILRELDQLATKAAEGTQIVICFSGHGTRVPIPAAQHPLDPKNPEPDGFDEAFVAADARLVNGEMQNLILDDELGQRLQKLRAQGANVWALFDCCHSGTMSRGVDDEASGEVSRELVAADLGVTAESIKQAEEKGVAAADGMPAADALNIFDAPVGEATKGSLVTFYAAQPFETAPDLPCPPNAPKTDKHYFGLLTYSTLQTLLRERPAGQTTYRELGQAIVGRYRAERGTRGPTPNFAGDLDREVLGLRTWPGRSQMLLLKSAAGWGINAGELQGLSTGSILALFPPGSGAEQLPSGYLRVTNVTPATAEIEPCEHNMVAALPEAKWQEAMRCEIVSRQLGDLRIKLCVAPAVAELQPITTIARNALSALSTSSAELVQATDDPAAPWQLLAVSPASALRDYQLTIAQPMVLLIRQGEILPGRATPGGETKSVGRVWQQYDPRDVAAFQEALAADIHKIFTWQNLWRIAGGHGTELADENSNLKVELASLAGADDKSGGKLLSQASVRPGDYLELRVSNEGANREWVTMVFLDADFRVVVLPTQQLNRAGGFDAALQPIVFQISPKASGPQSWLIIASSADANRLEPDFQFLAQSGLGRAARKPIVAERAGNSPFEALALAVAGKKGLFRGTVTPSDQNPSLILRSWTVTHPSTK
ncbi:Caspase domain protein [Anatilimnocola aggregata]|uniref:Caspase domain protein n=1 Tax=Anatilimnocola aggregata TaxID=2528021 RepID=A0A517YDM8_9BACT|nr:caspase family protein [Anatilimnocola aggregata]QDU28299.1 Caspase domain protein [Anatilimnocola aggregata]